jgi:hypothetical protein
VDPDRGAHHRRLARGETPSPEVEERGRTVVEED